MSEFYDYDHDYNLRSVNFSLNRHDNYKQEEERLARIRAEDEEARIANIEREVITLVLSTCNTTASREMYSSCWWKADYLSMIYKPVDSYIM